LFVFGALSQYLGAALAVGLFDNLPAPSVAWLRVLFGGVAMTLVLRTGWPTLDAAQRSAALGLGLSMALMNASFYIAIDQLPLGTAVAVEFVGPVSVAAVASRSTRSAVALACAAVGVVLVADVHLTANAGGLVAALLAAAGWAGYIVFGARVAERGAPAGGLLLAFIVASAALLPFGLAGGGDMVSMPQLIVLGALVGVLSSAVPYWIDQLVLRSLNAPTFAMLQSVLPVVAALVGASLLSQRLALLEWLGIGLVILGLMLRPPAAEGSSARPG
jgi:inner membrane transporter RhtA